MSTLTNISYEAGIISAPLVIATVVGDFVSNEKTKTLIQMTGIIGTGALLVYKSLQDRKEDEDWKQTALRTAVFMGGGALALIGLVGGISTLSETNESQASQDSYDTPFDIPGTQNYEHYTTEDSCGKKIPYRPCNPDHVENYFRKCQDLPLPIAIHVRKELLEKNELRENGTCTTKALTVIARDVFHCSHTKTDSDHLDCIRQHIVPDIARASKTDFEVQSALNSYAIAGQDPDHQKLSINLFTKFFGLSLENAIPERPIPNFNAQSQNRDELTYRASLKESLPNLPQGKYFIRGIKQSAYSKPERLHSYGHSTYLSIGEKGAPCMYYDPNRGIKFLPNDASLPGQIMRLLNQDVERWNLGYHRLYRVSGTQESIRNLPEQTEVD